MLVNCDKKCKNGSFVNCISQFVEEIAAYKLFFVVGAISFKILSILIIKSFFTSFDGTLLKGNVKGSALELISSAIWGVTKELKNT